MEVTMTRDISSVDNSTAVFSLVFMDELVET